MLTLRKKFRRNCNLNEAQNNMANIYNMKAYSTINKTNLRQTYYYGNK